MPERQLSLAALPHWDSQVGSAAKVETSKTSDLQMGDVSPRTFRGIVLSNNFPLWLLALRLCDWSRIDWLDESSGRFDEHPLIQFAISHLQGRLSKTALSLTDLK